MKLTDISIRHLEKPDKGQKTYRDDVLKGFAVRVSQGGTKSYVLIYGQHRRLITIGRVGIIPLSDARKEAKRILAEHTLGKHQPLNISFKDAKDIFLKDKEDNNRSRTHQEYKRVLNKYFKLSNTPVKDITQLEVMRRVSKISKQAEMHHAFVTIRAFLNWCVRHRYLDRSPISNIPLPNPPTARERVLSLDELKEIYSKATDYPYGHINRLLILTGQRRGEIANLKWDWIKDNTITFPPEITKNKKTHTIPLCPIALSVIKDIPETSEYLFPASRKMSKKTTVFNGWSKCKVAFDKTLEGVAPYTVHDIRRSVATKLAENGIPIHVTEKLLNHISGSHGGIVGIYQRYEYLDEIRDALLQLESQVA